MARGITGPEGTGPGDRQSQGRPTAWCASHHGSAMPAGPRQALVKLLPRQQGLGGSYLPHPSRDTSRSLRVLAENQHRWPHRTEAVNHLHNPRLELPVCSSTVGEPRHMTPTQESHGVDCAQHIVARAAQSTGAQTPHGRGGSLPQCVRKAGPPPQRTERAEH